VEELADRLVKKEEESARGLADAEALEARLDETNERSSDQLAYGINWLTSSTLDY
jgi:hypothetical protein